MDPLDLQQPSGPVDEPQNPLNEELDIPDDVFINQENVAPPQPKTRANVMQFEQELSQKAGMANDEVYRARKRVERVETAKYKVQKALTQTNNENSLIALIRTISNDIGSINRNISTMQTTISTMQTDINSIKDEVSGMKPLMLYVRTSENARRRELREPPIPVPFLVGEGPDGTDLPSINSVEDIELLDLEQLRRFLTGYNVRYASRTSRVNMKIMLRDTLGFCKVSDMRMNFS